MGVSISRTQARAGRREVPSDRGRLARRFCSASRRSVFHARFSPRKTRAGGISSAESSRDNSINDKKTDQTFNRNRRNRRSGGIVIFNQGLSAVFAQGAEVRREKLFVLS